MKNVSIKNNLILILYFIFYSQFSYAEKIVFNIDNQIINKAIFDDSFNDENTRNYIEIYHKNDLVGKIPSFDEDGGNRLDKIISRYDGRNLIRVITSFPDRGHFKIFYDIGFDQSHKLFILHQVSFEFKQWQSDDILYSKYCYKNFNTSLEQLEQNPSFFETIRPSVDGWENGRLQGSCTESNKEIDFENVYKVVSKSYFYNEPDLSTQTKMHLIEGDYVTFLQKKDHFYKVAYITNKNKTIHKWLHCSAIDAC